MVDYLNYSQCSVDFYLLTSALFVLLTPKICFPLLGVFIIRSLLHWMHYCLSFVVDQIPSELGDRGAMQKPRKKLRVDKGGHQNKKAVQLSRGAQSD